MDYDLAADIFQASPVFQESPLYPQIIDDQLGLQIQNMAYSMVGGPPSSDPRLSYPEVIRALSQHYGYATLFIDVSLNPVVAALFATNRWTDSGHLVREEGDSVVFRWPAVRKSLSRLVIGAEGGDSATVNVIDISRISPHMRRPHNQRAALATPAHDPKPVYQPLNSPISDMVFEDMAELPCCESITIPAGGGHQLNQLDGVSMTALYPDAIDLGYSYISVIAQLSMLLPWAIDHQHVPPNAAMENVKRHALAIGRTILDRECLRNVPRLPVPEHLPNMTAEEARRSLASLGQAAYAAIELMDTDEIKKQVEPALKRRLEDVRAEVDRRHAAYVEALKNVVGPERVAAMDPPKPEYSISLPSRPEWVRGELDARLQKVQTILETADFVPVYALDRPAEFRSHIDSLPSSHDYEETVMEQLAAQKRWLQCQLYDVNPTSRNQENQE